MRFSIHLQQFAPQEYLEICFVTIIWQDANQENVLIFYNHIKFFQTSVRWLVKIAQYLIFSKFGVTIICLLIHEI